MLFRSVHDGVRPFVSVEVIRRCYDLAKVQKAVIPVVDVVETLRHLTDAGSETVSRNDYKLVQTPQVFDVELLKQAYAQEFTPFFTDDASVVEAMGIPVYLAEGNRENIKITTTKPTFVMLNTSRISIVAVICSFSSGANIPSIAAFTSSIAS